MVMVPVTVMVKLLERQEREQMMPVLTAQPKRCRKVLRVWL
jgi:hypothetical protein